MSNIFPGVYTIITLGMTCIYAVHIHNPEGNRTPISRMKTWCRTIRLRGQGARGGPWS